MRLSPSFYISVTIAGLMMLLLGCGGAATAEPPSATAVIPPAPTLITPAPPTATETATAVPTAPPSNPTAEPKPDPLYLPLIGAAEPTTATPAAVAAADTPAPLPSPTPIPTLDFSALRTSLQAQGQTLQTVKMGFHTSLGGNQEGLTDWMSRLDEAGVPFFLKSVDNAEPLFRAQEMMAQSGVPHTLVYRRTGNGYDVPRYDLPPAEAAQLHWQLHRDVFPPELDPSVVWIETINEPDKSRAEWLAEFALTTAELALADGFKWAAFGWASGEPEPADWQSPAMVRFLALAGQHPDRLAIALHEYSYLVDDIRHEFPYKVGRFQQLFAAADANGLPRPTVLITEWGWTYQNVPAPEQAMADLAWAAELYAPYPQIKGAAIWYLGPGYGDIDNQTQRLIAPLTLYTLTHYFVIVE